MSDEELVAFMRATMVDGREPAPSIETPLHSMLPFRFVVHTHDFATQALTDTTHPEALVREALGAEVAYVDYFRPGFPLARAVMDLGSLDPGTRGLVLGRHGLVAWGETAKDCYDNLHRLIGLAEGFVAKGRGTHAVAPFGETKVAAAEPARRRQRAVELLPEAAGAALARKAGDPALRRLAGGASPSRGRRTRRPSSAAACRRPSTSCAAAAFPFTSTPTSGPSRRPMPSAPSRRP